MANNAIGFIYITHQTDRYQDIKIKRLKNEFKCDGVAVYDYICNEIYRVKGSYIEWDEHTVFDVADYWGLKETRVQEIVNYCCFVGLFNKALLAKESVISAQSIQSRFIDWSQKAKRKHAKIPENYRLIQEESVNLPETSCKIPEGSDVKKSKVSKSEVSTYTHEGFFQMILEFFGFSELSHFQNFKLLSECCSALDGASRLEEFKLQFNNYRQLKLKTGYKHNFNKFLGSQENRFEDGVWCAENWQKKLNEETLIKSKKNESAPVFPNHFNKKLMESLPVDQQKHYRKHLNNQGLYFTGEYTNNGSDPVWEKLNN